MWTTLKIEDKISHVIVMSFFPTAMGMETHLLSIVYDIMSTKNNNDIFRLSNFKYKAFLLRDKYQ